MLGHNSAENPIGGDGTLELGDDPPLRLQSGFVPGIQLKTSTRADLAGRSSPQFRAFIRIVALQRSQVGREKRDRLLGVVVPVEVPHLSPTAYRKRAGWAGLHTDSVQRVALVLVDWLIRKLRRRAQTVQVSDCQLSAIHRAWALAAALS